MANDGRILIYFDELVTALARLYGETMNTHIYSPRDILSSMQGISHVDAVEVVHGEWVKQEEEYCYWYECSECAGVVPRTRYGHDWYSDYCPNCGAKMDGDGNG